MEHQRRFEQHRSLDPGGNPPQGSHLDQQRSEIDDLLRAADHVFDSINNQQAQQYLSQNLQTGGE